MGRGGWVVLGTMVALLLGAVAAVAWVWIPHEEAGMSGHGVLAMVLGVLGTFAVGAGLMALVFFSHRSGHDQAVHDEGRRVTGTDHDR